MKRYIQRGRHRERQTDRQRQRQRGEGKERTTDETKDGLMKDRVPIEHFVMLLIAKRGE